MTDDSITYNDLETKAPLVPTSESQQLEAFNAELERKKALRLLYVPTNDVDVRNALQSLNLPPVLDGEDRSDRRDRLANFLLDNKMSLPEPSLPSEPLHLPQKQTRSEGVPLLADTRRAIAQSSLSRAATIHKIQSIFSQFPAKYHESMQMHLSKSFENMSLYSSEILFDRPAAAVCISPNAKLAAIGSWSGQLRFLNPHTLATQDFTQASHSDRICGISWNPTFGSASSPLSMATSSADGTIFLRNISQNDPLAVLEDSKARVNSVKFDPAGQFLASASYDSTWSLWDINSTSKVLKQDGHSKGVHDLAFHPAGSLIATAGLDAHAYVWDLRCDKIVMILNGHNREIYAIDFASNGFHIATGSADNSLKIWDLRQTKQLTTLPAHNSIISSINYCPPIQMDIPAEPNYEAHIDPGSVLASASYDGTIKLWSATSFRLLKTLKSSSPKIFSVDISPNAEYIISSHNDRSVCLWNSI
ncbi:hypothetical protein CANCADRAFT_99491 [Tortispora caseinolytica NRRL Y-17796]|uniref:Uncharacterized protein n=1 Tax=Tortispora caseinolytica NRRL Y-17796 TaxID=767744 RepID=A0A1E4TE07_9ASCO|nr:hypothetical protein CANCADRAFT_99491 [Tortispora caseinolytica NRRL Y-17796]